MRMPVTVLAIVAFTACVCALSAARQAPAPDKAGYTDTPMLPGGKWHVHDPARPDAPVVAPRAGCPPTTPKRAPAAALVLFDGKDLSAWTTLDGKEPGWILKDGVAQIPTEHTANGGDIRTKREFGDCQVHVEWSTPVPPPGTEHSFNRGNSGVFLQGLYEVQIFDSYKNDYLYADGQAGAIYGQYPPSANVCRAPEQWQEFDITFHPARFRDGKLEAPARITVLQNGVKVQDNVAILGPTGHRILATYDRALPATGPLVLQAHGCPVRFRNIWLTELKATGP